MSQCCLDLSKEFDQGFLVGFIEAEGSFYISNRPGFSIAQTKSNILEEIKTAVGLGGIYGGSLQIGSIAGFEIIIDLCNGNLKLPYRQQQFKKWLSAFNAKCIHKTTFVRYKKPRNSYQISNFDEGWIMGMCEGEGCFTVRKDGYPVFNVTNNDRKALEVIKRFFKGGNIIPHSKTGRAWRYQVMHDSETLEKVRLFFKGRMKVDKKIDQFNRWVKLFDYSNPLRAEGREREKLRGRQMYHTDPQAHIKAVKSWRGKNRGKWNSYKRKTWWKHRTKNLVKHRERTIISRAMNYWVRESVELCLETA
jgi:hypothetical protein